jgi:SAM-dependent MidA family methyltransferase
MESALYDPAGGYYARGARIGEGGDFATSPSLTPLFARAIARRFRATTGSLEGSLDFVEIGAGSGAFLEDFACALALEDPSLAARLRWTAVEKSAAGREALSLRRFPKGLRVVESAQDLAERSVRGWIFSNELYDALPVFRVRAGEAGLEELRVGIAGEAFGWTAVPAPADLVDYLARRRIVLQPGQIADVSLEAAPLHRSLARALDRGCLVAFDYGHRAATLYHSLARPSGTLAVHSGGRRGGDPLDRPGEKDLTAHVNWDELIRAGEAEGLATAGIFRQGRYLTEAGLFELAETEAERWRAFRLVDPEGMGEELSVLVQTRL